MNNTKLQGKLQKFIDKFTEIETKLSNIELQHEEMIQLSKERAEIEEIVEVAKKRDELINEELGARELLSDPDMREMAEGEMQRIKGEVEQIDESLKILLMPKSEDDKKNAILEIRAGTGGDEAALFVANLYKMYLKYAENQGWKIEPISISSNDIGGFKEIITSFSGRDVFLKMKFESGVHRVQMYFAQ